MGRKLTSGVRILLQFLAALLIAVFWFQAHFNWNYIDLVPGDIIIFSAAVALYMLAWWIEVFTWLEIHMKAVCGFPIKSSTGCFGWMNTSQNVHAMHYGGLALMALALEEVSLKDSAREQGDLFRALLYVGVVLLEIGVFTWGIDEIQDEAEGTTTQQNPLSDSAVTAKVSGKVPALYTF